MSGHISQWIEHYGVVGVFITAAVEGELGVLIGGAMARLGKLNPFHVALAAWVAAFLSAQLFFYLGRSQRDSKWVHKVTDKRAFALALHWIERHPRLFCLFYRFIYGFRIVGPVAISLSQVNAHLFWVMNIFTALGWACVGVGLGWFVGPEIAHWLGQWFTPHRFAIASAVAAALLLIVISWRARRAAARRASDKDKAAIAEPVHPGAI